MESPSNLGKVNKMDLPWMLSYHLLKETPMWRSWNSLAHEDRLPLQTTDYMENIELPRRLDVIQETLRLSQMVAEECEEKYA